MTNLLIYYDRRVDNMFYETDWILLSVEEDLTIDNVATLHQKLRQFNKMYTYETIEDELENIAKCAKLTKIEEPKIDWKDEADFMVCLFLYNIAEDFMNTLKEEYQVKDVSVDELVIGLSKIYNILNPEQRPSSRVPKNEILGCYERIKSNNYNFDIEFTELDAIYNPFGENVYVGDVVSMEMKDGEYENCKIVSINDDTFLCEHEGIVKEMKLDDIVLFSSKLM